MTDVIVIFLCGLFFALLPPKQPEKLQFYKNEKINRRYHYFTHLYQKFWSDDVRFLRYGVWQTDRQMDGWTDEWTDGQKKWHIKEGAPTKKQSYHRHIQVVWETIILAWAPKLWCPKNTFQVCFFQNGSTYFKMAQNKKMETEKKNNETKRSKWQKKLSIKVFSFI